MYRIVTLAAAAALIATTASAETIRISTKGKTAVELKADVAKAARAVCVEATANATFRQEELSACVARTVSKTMAQAPAQAVMLAQR